MKRSFVVSGLLLAMALGFCMISADAHAFVSIDVFRDGYVEDVTFDGSALDGVADRISETNALLTVRGQFGDFVVDSRAIMSFALAPYAGLHLSSATFYGYGGRVDVYDGDPLIAQLFGFSGDGFVGLDDFDASALYLSLLTYPGNDSPFIVDGKFVRPFNEHFALLSADVTSGVQTLLDQSANYMEFRLVSQDSTGYLSAGEGHSLDEFGLGGPRLVLDFVQDEGGQPVVPEPATMVLFGFGAAGMGFLKKFYV